MPDQSLPPHNEVVTGAARPQQPGPIRQLLERLLGPKGGER